MGPTKKNALFNTIVEICDMHTYPLSRCQVLKQLYRPLLVSVRLPFFVRCSDSLFKDHLAQLMSPYALIIVKWSISTTNVENEGRIRKALGPSLV
jgi:hypothetical protein